MRKYESPIEEMIGRRLEKRLLPAVEWSTQVKVEPGRERYRADFLLKHQSRTVVIECDGREFHDFNEDKSRDIAMLDHSVDDVIRLNGPDIFFNAEDAFECLTTYLPFLFSDRAPLTFDDKCLVSMKYASSYAKPIFRSLSPLIEWRQSPEPCLSLPTVNLLGSARGGEVIAATFISPNWNRNYGGPHVWQIADYLRVKASKYERDQWLASMA